MRRRWTEAEDAQIRARYPHESTAALAAALGRSIGSVYQRAYGFGLEKSADYLASPAACRTNGRQGMGTRFAKGHVPANKGLRRPGWGPGRMKQTQFRKGQRSGAAAWKYKPIGAERLSKDGYLERKTHDALPEGITPQDANRLRQRRWKGVHVLVWEDAHGPIPQGFAVCFKDGNKTNCALDNLELVSRRDLMLRNSVHNYPKPIAEAIQLLGALKRQIRKRTHGQEQDERPA